MDARDRMRQQLETRRAGFSLTRDFYTDPDFYQLDLDQIYYRTWLFVGHDGELPQPGSYLTVQIGDYPILLVRDRAGEIRAFHNSCRHRGSRLCAAAKGRVGKLVCPYHQWTYELDGRLRFARDMGADFDPAGFGLQPVACEGVGGWLFVCLAEDPPDFAPMRALAGPYLAPHRLTEAKVAFESTIVEQGNWKLVWENNRECYHCRRNHPELCRTFPEAPTVTGVDAAMRDPVIAAHWQRCEAAGLPSQFRITADGQCRATRVPLLRDAESYTLSGQVAVRRPLSDAVTTPQIGALLLFHYPSCWNHVLGDHAISFRVLPLGPRATELTTKWLVHKDAVEGVDYQVEELTRVWQATNDQDRQIIEENQRGVASPAYWPGPYAPEHEGGVMQFVEWYCAQMAAGLASMPERRSRVA
jgi:Rieske 2Fe-2S family protein